MRVAAVQLNSTGDKARNLETAEGLVRDAAAAGAELVALPEKRNLLAPGEELVAGAEPLDGPTSAPAAAGRGSSESTSWPARSPSASVGAKALRHLGPDRPRGRGPRHLPKDPHVRRRRRRSLLRESAHEQPGEEIVTAPVGDLIAGLTVCYDLRFPELHRILAVRGARLITVPAAFTTATGRDHWEVLLRARAIENAVFVLAPGQVGKAPPHFDGFGRSAIVDPWGVVLATAPDAECFIAADLDLAAQERTASSPGARQPPPAGLRLAQLAAAHPWGDA